MTRVGLRIGIDANLPLILDEPRRGDLAPQVAKPEIIADAGAGWVRLNFVLGPWSGPADTTLHQGRTWEGAYRAIIGGLRAKGLNIYGLISNEAVALEVKDRFRSPPVGVPSDAWLDKYVDNFVAIVRMFRRDVQIFESFNEPDDWHGANEDWPEERRNWVNPAWFAVILQRIHEAVRSEDDIRNVRLISGPLQGLEGNLNAAATYLGKTYAWGKASLGWGKSGVSFPFDGVGYHLYIKEAHNPDWPVQEAAVRAMYQRYVSDMARVIQEQEHRPKSLYISEIGWHSHEDQGFQARNLSLGLNLVAEDPKVSLAFWFCTQDFGSNGGRKWYGLYKPGQLTPANRKPAFEAFRAVCEADLEPQVTIVYTNQQVINAFHDAALAMGLSNPWELLERAVLNLGSMVQERSGRYCGPAIDVLPNLTIDEKALVKSKLPAARLFAPAGAVSFGMGAAPGFLRMQQDLFDIPLAPPAAQILDPDSAAIWTQRVVIETWNRYGGLLGGLSERVEIDPAVAVAVLAIEAGGRAFSADGRMIIRFENHIFFDRWGTGHGDVFARYFRFEPDPARRWQKHEWRPAESEPWREFHGSQRGEWEVFDLACRLSDHDARLSISMGAPQIMGFNHAAIGYSAVEEMFDAFSTSAHSQILGFFDFVRGPSGGSQRLAALQQRDFATFAALYNGPGQAARYASLLKDAVDAYRAMRGG
jgi:hypothetical protein